MKSKSMVIDMLTLSNMADHVIMSRYVVLEDKNLKQNHIDSLKVGTDGMSHNDLK